MDDENTYSQFVDGETSEIWLDIGEPVGRVVVHEYGSTVICEAEWAGWRWLGEGTDRSTALRRLETRLARVNPFDGFDTDWGEPGYQISELDDDIPAGMRELMRRWEEFREKSESEVMRFAYQALLDSRDSESR